MYLSFSTTTGNGGQYAFSNLLFGSYFIEVGDPAVVNFSPLDQGDDDQLDSDADPTTGRSMAFNLAIGGNNDTVDCGIIPIVIITDVESLTVPEDGTAEIGRETRLFAIVVDFPG